MKWAIVLLVMLLIAVTSAETIPFSGYNWTFDIGKQHSVDGGIIRTCNGSLSFIAPPTGVNFGDAKYIGSVKSLNIIFNLYYLAPDDYMAFDSNSVVADGTRLGIGVESTMNLTDTKDFMKTLKVERIKGS